MSLLSSFKKFDARTLISLAIILLMLLHVSHLLPLSFVNQLEQYSYDARLRLFMPNTVDKRIVIVDIDEKSLKEQGQWPWGRNKLALLVNKLFDDYHINTLGFDVVFAEKDASSGLKNLEAIANNQLKGNAQFNQTLQQLKPSLDYDQIFANSLKNRKVVLGYYFLQNGSRQQLGMLPLPSYESDGFQADAMAFDEATGYGANLSMLQQNAFSAGHFDPALDDDGLSRRVSVLVKYAGKYYQSLAVAVAAAYLQKPLLPRIEQNNLAGYTGLEEIRLGKHRIPVDEEASALIPYHGRQGSFVYVSATDVLNHRVPVATLKDKIVLVGTTAAGLQDLRATPVEAAYPGVEIHANLIAGILDNNIKERPYYMLAIEFVLAILAGLLLIIILPMLNPLKATLFTLAVLATLLVLALVCWQYANWVLPIAGLLLMISMIYFVNMSYGFFVESREKRQLAGIFGQYVPPELVREMAENPEKISLIGESREMTVLFSDIRGFTSISEDLSPQQLTQLMGEFLTPMTKVIHQNRGTIDKYMGDAIMAFWGAPLRDAQHAMHALEAAMQMRAAVAEINAAFAAKGWPEIQVGVGLNTGNMVVGNMGSSFRMAYTVMGDAVNLSSRVEGLTKYYGVGIVVTEFVKAQTPEMLYRELDCVRVKGKDVAVRIFEPLGTTLVPEEARALNQYHEALSLYRQQHWDAAEQQLLDLQQYAPLPVYEIYIERIKAFKRRPPGANWDGACNFETK